MSILTDSSPLQPLLLLVEAQQRLKFRQNPVTPSNSPVFGFSLGITISATSERLSVRGGEGGEDSLGELGVGKNGLQPRLPR